MNQIVHHPRVCGWKTGTCDMRSWFEFISTIYTAIWKEEEEEGRKDGVCVCEGERGFKNERFLKKIKNLWVLFWISVPKVPFKVRLTYNGEGLISF